MGIECYEGIKIEKNADRIKARNEFIHVHSRNLVADLGDGVFVVKKGTTKILERKGITYKKVKIVKGVPPEVREHGEAFFSHGNTP
jgi:hypothetical protein